MSKPSIVDVSVPSLETLAVVLRDSSLWPGEFRWNYANCSSCAIGLIVEFWHPRARLELGLTASEYCNVFHEVCHDGNPNYSKDLVTPEEVAATIDKIILRKSVVV